MIKNYFRLILGRKHTHFEECYKNNYIGVSFGIDKDLSNDLPENWRDFNKKYIPLYLEKNPDKSKVTAGLACGAIHTVSKSINIGDHVICPDGSGKYYVGVVKSEYVYKPDRPLFHCREVEWLRTSINRSDMSQELQNSTGSIGTISNITKYSNELQNFISDNNQNDVLTSIDKNIEDPSMFALERHLEDFLIANWKQTEIAQNYDIYEDDELFGQQFPTDTGPIDILAISKDKKELLVIELKKGRASDSVVGQIQRYMGYIKSEFLESDQKVRGIIIALEEDLKLKRALSVTNDIEFYRYKINFELINSK